ncbi:hypothetical protein L9F63_027788, partial [Diploptera punctata]
IVKGEKYEKRIENFVIKLGSSAISKFMVLRMAERIARRASSKNLKMELYGILLN